MIARSCTLTLAALLAACAPLETPPAPSPLPTATLMARAETDPVGTIGQDAADDPAIWRNLADPSASLIVGTDKKGGIYVYDLMGKVLSFTDAEAVNNVDLVELDDGRILVGASDRSDPANAGILFYFLDPESAALTPAGRIAAGPGEGYGFCFGTSERGLPLAYSPVKEGAIYESALTLNGTMIGGRTTRTMRVDTQPEGCVVDRPGNQLYVGEEAAGIWRFDLSMTTPSKRMLISADHPGIVPDIEGLAIMPRTGGSVLIASSQGDGAFVLVDLKDDAYLGRFRIGDGVVDGTVETDGIEFAAGDFGPNYPGGLFVVQDGDNENGTQNFKFVAGADIEQLVP